MKLKIGDRVEFDFLGIIEVGIIERISPPSHGVDQELRYFINDGSYIYPIKVKKIKKKL